MSEPTPPTEADAMAITKDFFAAADAMERGDRDGAAIAFSGPPVDDATVTQRMFRMFVIGATIAGRSVRKAMAGPITPATTDAFVALELVDGETGEHADPSQVPPQLRHIMWSVSAGANLDGQAIGAHLRYTHDMFGYQGVLDAIYTFAQITAKTHGTIEALAAEVDETSEETS